MKLPEHTNRRAVLRTIGAGVVGGVGVASTPALAKKGGSGVFGVPGTDEGPFKFYHEDEPFVLTSLGEPPITDAVSCMAREKSAQKTPYPYTVDYENKDVEEFLILAFSEESVAEALDTSETFEFVSLTDCDDQYGIARFRTNK